VFIALGPPGAPRNLHVTDITTSAISIGWEPPESDGTCDVTQYNIDMREEQEANYSAVAKVSNRITSYTVEELHRGRLYRFRVRAKNAAGYSESAAELDGPVQLKALGIFAFSVENNHRVVLRCCVSVFLTIYADWSRVSIAVIRVCVLVCDFVRMFVRTLESKRLKLKSSKKNTKVGTGIVHLFVRTHEKIKTAKNKITKLGTGIVHHDVSLINEYQIKRSKVKVPGSKMQKAIEWPA